MKQKLILLMFAGFTLGVAAQSDSTVLFAPSKTGMFIKDGTEEEIIEADDVHREKLNTGDHYIQLKMPAKKYNVAIKMPGLISGIVKIGCEDVGVRMAAFIVNRHLALDK